MIDQHSQTNSYYSHKRDHLLAIYEVYVDRQMKLIGNSGIKDLATTVGLSGEGQNRTAERRDVLVTCSAFGLSGEGQNRTADTVIFSHVLCRLSYLAASVAS